MSIFGKTGHNHLSQNNLHTISGPTGASKVGVPRHKVGWANGLYFQASIGTLKNYTTNKSRGVDGAGETPPDQKIM